MIRGCPALAYSDFLNLDFFTKGDINFDPKFGVLGLFNSKINPFNLKIYIWLKTTCFSENDGTNIMNIW